MLHGFLFFSFFFIFFLGNPLNGYKCRTKYTEHNRIRSRLQGGSFPGGEGWRLEEAKEGVGGDGSRGGFAGRDFLKLWVYATGEVSTIEPRSQHKSENGNIKRGAFRARSCKS